LVLSPLGKQVVVSAELGPEEEVGLRLLFLPRLKVEATSGGASRLSCFFSGRRDKGLRSGLLMWWKNPNSGLWPGLRSSSRLPSREELCLKYSQRESLTSSSLLNCTRSTLDVSPAHKPLFLNTIDLSLTPENTELFTGASQASSSKKGFSCRQASSSCARKSITLPWPPKSPKSSSPPCERSTPTQLWKSPVPCWTCGWEASKGFSGWL